MRLLFIALFSIMTNGLMAQTKEIAFKSHSGNMKNFKVALENELFDTEEANFGLPPDKKTYKLDSVIYISDTVAVLVTRTYSRPYKAPADSNKLVKSGKDTVYNDPLFMRQHSLDSIKKVLKANGKYINPLNKTIFIGFDNNKKNETKAKISNNQQPVKNMILPVITKENNNNNNTPFDNQLILILGTIIAVSTAGGWLSWKFYQPRLQKA